MPPRRQEPKSAKIRVPDVSSMMAQTFRLHCQTRHPNLRFWARGEHEADHRLHHVSIDHIHESVRKDDVSTGAGEQD